jgi:hypothetical protein
MEYDVSSSCVRSNVSHRSGVMTAFIIAPVSAGLSFGWFSSGAR